MRRDHNEAITFERLMTEIARDPFTSEETRSRAKEMLSRVEKRGKSKGWIN